MMRSLSFDGLVELYDETRSCDRRCFVSALRYIANTSPASNFPRVLEPGIGSGRIAIPLARFGYHVTGADISEEMLFALQRRLQPGPLKQPITFSRANVTRLPFADNTFDMAIVVHLFYFIRAWKKAVEEILRVIRKTGPIVLMHTGTGAEIPSLNQRYRELCAALHSPIPTMGAKSTRQVVDYFCLLGCQAEWIRDRWQWTSKIPLDKALGYIENRAYSFTTFAPDSIHAEATARLKTELKSKFKSLNTVIEVPNQVYLVILSKS